MKSLIFLTGFLSLALSSPLPEVVDPDVTPAIAPPKFKIINASHGGSGCPQGSLNFTWTDTTLPITFPPDFTAEIGPGVPPAQSRKNCQLSIEIKTEPGYALAVWSSTVSGWADIEKGAEGQIRSVVYFSGEEKTMASQLVLSGPYRGVYEKRDYVPLKTWSGCTGEILLNVNSAVMLRADDGAVKGRITQTRESGRLTEQFYVQWKKC